MFASYRVWRKERLEATARLAVKDSALAELRDRIADLVAKQQKPRFKVTISAEGNPPSQVLNLSQVNQSRCHELITCLSTEAAIAGEDVSREGQAVEIPINDGLLLKVWNTARADRNHYDNSGPAKIGVTLSSDGRGHQFILPIQMESTMQNNTMYRKVIGSKTFQSE